MAIAWEFADEMFEIEEQTIIGGRSSRIRKRAFRDPNYSLKDMLLDGRRDESSTYQAKHIESKEEMSELTAATERFRANQNNKSQTVCSHCGGTFPHKRPCPAKGKHAENLISLIILPLHAEVLKLPNKTKHILSQERSPVQSGHYNMKVITVTMSVCMLLVQSIQPKEHLG